MKTLILYFSFCITLFFCSQALSHNYRLGEVILTSYGKSYVVGETLGKGGFGTVYKVTELQKSTFLSHFRSQKPETHFALKVISNDFYKSDTFEEFYKKYNYVTKALVGSPYFVEIYKHGHLMQNGRPNKNSTVVEMELLDGVDLHSNPHALEWRPTLSDEVSSVVLNRLQSFVDFGINAIQILSAHKITHSDLGPKNIIFGKSGKFKIIDFDFINIPGAQTYSYDPSYSPNEVLNDQLIPGASDFYSLGMVVARFLTGKPPIHSYKNSLSVDFELYAMADADDFDEDESFFNRIQSSRAHHKAMIEQMSNKLEDLSLQISHPELRAQFMELAKFSLQTTKYNPIDRSFVWKNTFYSHLGKVISTSQNTSTDTYVEIDDKVSTCNQTLKNI